MRWTRQTRPRHHLHSRIVHSSVHVMRPVLASTSRTQTPVMCTIIDRRSPYLSQPASSTRLFYHFKLSDFTRHCLCVGYNIVWSGLCECNEHHPLQTCCNLLISWPAKLTPPPSPRTLARGIDVSAGYRPVFSLYNTFVNLR